MKTLVLLAFLSACTSAHRSDADDSPDAGDSQLLCGDTVCDSTRASVCVDGDTLRTYTSTCEDDVCAYPATDVECGVLGCCNDHCCGVSPSNSTELGELHSTGLEVEALTGTFDTTADCTDDSRLGECSVVARTDLPEVCVCRADRIRIGSLRVTGSRALALLASRDVLVTGVLDISGRGAVDGPGASHPPEPQMDKVSGGPGGSHGSRGGSAGSRTSSEVAGTQTLIPLTGGMRGVGSGGLGGGGGGAVQITAGVRIDIVGTIEAGGGGGLAAPASVTVVGGGGGGSGGAILLEAPVMIVGGRLLANGGGGAGGTGGTIAGTAGWNAADIASHGMPITSAALGGGSGRYFCETFSDLYAGVGGAGATGTIPAGLGAGGYETSCNGPTVSAGGGGGGGGVGRIRINTTTECECGGAVLPAATFGTVSSR